MDNRTIIVPNAAIIAKNITNYSKKQRRRVDHIFTIGYDDDLRLAKKVLLDLMHEDERVLEDPAPFVAVGNLGERGIEFTFRAWAKTGDYWGVYFDMPEKVKLAFDEHNLSIPYPQLNVHTEN